MYFYIFGTNIVTPSIHPGVHVRIGRVKTAKSNNRTIVEI